MRPISGSSESPPRTRSTALRVHVGTGASLSVRSTSQASATIAAIGHHSFVSPYGMHCPLRTSACCSHSAISPSSLASLDFPRPASPVRSTRWARLRAVAVASAARKTATSLSRPTSGVSTRRWR